MTAIFQFVINIILPLVFVLGLLIFVHELGHFLAAKLAGIRVERFSLGFPPRLIGKKIGDTDYCLSAIPFGGYVKMSGMIDESLDKDGIKGEPYEFMSKPIPSRVGVLAAGPLMNLLLAVFLFAGVTYFTGIPVGLGPVVGEVLEGGPAAEVGLKPGDRIVSLDGKSIETWDDMVKIIKANPEKEISLTYEREGQTLTATIIPKLDKINSVGVIGIVQATNMRAAGFFESIGQGFKTTWTQIAMIGKFFGKVFQRKIDAREGLGGPVAIGKIIIEASRAGLRTLLWVTAFISLNLGLINILPIPVLDGGHIVFLGIEAVKRKPVSVKTRLVVQQVGMVLLIALMVFFIFNDINRFF